MFKNSTHHSKHTVCRKDTMDAETPQKTLLTPREHQVLILMASSYHNKEIATILGMSEHTAKFHINSIMRKTGQTTRLGATMHCLKSNIITLASLMVYTPDAVPTPTQEE